MSATSNFIVHFFGRLWLAFAIDEFHEAGVKHHHVATDGTPAWLFHIWGIWSFPIYETYYAGMTDHGVSEKGNASHHGKPQCSF
jgi:hypothetical protein